MKKVILLVVLVTLNFIIYHYLTEHIGINATYEEISLSLIASIISIPLFSTIPALFIYLLKLNLQKVFIPYKKIYLNLYLNVSIALYSIMLLVALLVYLKMKY